MNCLHSQIFFFVAMPLAIAIPDTCVPEVAYSYVDVLELLQRKRTTTLG